MYLRRDCIANATKGWKHAEKGKGAAVHHFLPVHLYRQLTIVSLNQKDINAELLP
jgi:hypothetical protein